MLVIVMKCSAHRSSSNRPPGAPLTYFSDGGDFFGTMKDAGISWGRKKTQRDFSGLRKKD